MDVAVGLWVSYYHSSPLVIILRSEGHNVAKIWPVVVLWLYRLMAKKKNILKIMFYPTCLSSLELNS